MTLAYIDELPDRLGFEPICRVLAEHDQRIAPSTYWAHRACPVSAADWDDAHMASAALEVWRASRSLHGADRLATAMVRAGHRVGRDQVARLMRMLGIEGATRGRHRTVTTRRDPGAARHPDLIRRAWGAPTRPDEWWVADLTYVWALDEFVCTSFVTDVLPVDSGLAGLGVEGDAAGDVGVGTGPAHPPPPRRPVQLQGAGAPLRRRIAAHRGQPHRGARRGRHRRLHRDRRRRLGQRADGVDDRAVQDRAHRPRPGPLLGRPGRGRTRDGQLVHWYSTTRIHHSIAKMSPVELEALHARAAQEPAA